MSPGWWPAVSASHHDVLFTLMVERPSDTMGGSRSVGVAGGARGPGKNLRAASGGSSAVYLAGLAVFLVLLASTGMIGIKEQPAFLLVLAIFPRSPSSLFLITACI